MVYQKSARVSFDAGGSEFFVKRHSTALTNASGYQAHGDAVYRISRRTSLGVFYGYTAYKFARGLGDSNVHSTGFDFSYAFSRSVELKLRVGGSRVETYGISLVSLSPIVALLLGQTVGIQRVYTRSFVPDFAGEFSKQRQRSNMGVAVAFGISPGNGLYLTSKHDSETIYYNFTGFRSYALGLSAGRDRLGSIGGVTGSYASYYVRFNASKPLRHHLNATFNADVRQLGFSSADYHRKAYRITAGIAYAPGEGPLKFW
jgi:hypothetical protein